MSLAPLAIIDTRHLFRPVSSQLVPLLRQLSQDEWQRPTIAGSWVVRDVVAHLVDLTFRRLSFQRDRLVPPPPPREIRGERDFVEFINWLNREWVQATSRLSPQVLTDLFEKASSDLADFFEALPLDTPALFGVSWAGEDTSAGWFDIGREFTELWHHQAQIRMAIGAPPLDDPRYLKAALEIAMRGLPHAYRHVAAKTGDAVGVDVSGPAGGRWTLRRDDHHWTIWQGGLAHPAAHVELSDDVAWRLLFNALGERDALLAIEASGRQELVQPLLRARSIVV